MNLTDLELSLPDKQTIKESLVSTSITKLTQELEQLPYGNMPEALDQVTSKLALLNRTQMGPNSRFEILECFLQPFQMFFEHVTAMKTENILKPLKKPVTNFLALPMN
ncbi:MAG: hypothetical protein JKX83_04565 [Pseudomonadales bacterium]|nr:hypothetical protein [Pseudomonadales bacterium]